MIGLSLISKFAFICLLVNQAFSYDQIEENIQKLANANNRFALNLYKEVSRDDEGNLFISTLGAFFTLGMLHLGAGGRTAQELNSAMGIEDDLTHYGSRHQFYKSFRLIKERVETRHSLSNGLLALAGERLTFPVLDSYRDYLKRYFDGEIARDDMKENGVEIMKYVNSWAREVTGGRIQQFLDEPPNEFTVLMLLNAAHLRLQLHFDHENTKLGQFYNYDGSTTSVPMMHHYGKFLYTYSEELASGILQIPFSSAGDMHMYILLPAQEENFDELDRKLSNGNVLKELQGLKETYANISIPMMKIESEYDLNPVLRRLGVRKALNGEANLAGITGHSDMFVTKTVQKAGLHIIETRSAGYRNDDVRAESINYFVNRPFAFLIYDNHTKTIVFMGRVKQVQRY